MLPWVSPRAFKWTNAHQVYRHEIEEGEFALWTFLQTWDADNFRRVAMGLLDRFEKDAFHELSVVGSKVTAVGSSASTVSISGMPHILAETYVEYLGSEYKGRLVEYAIFDLRLLQRCL